MSRARWLGRAALLLWELPQNLLGLALLQGMRAQGRVRGLRWEREHLFIHIDALWAVSLGWFVFWSDMGSPAPGLVGAQNRDHEYGHAIQSRWLGPLYLLVVGVPSLSRVFYALLYQRRHGRSWTGYYDGFPENWADRLGGVARHRPPALRRGRLVR